MKSCGSAVTLWVLLEVPPHGCCPPWPETTGRVAEWCGRDAGLRYAGVGSRGGKRAHTHAVGVRAYGVVRVTQTTLCADATDRVICVVSRHKQSGGSFITILLSLQLLFKQLLINQSIIVRLA